MGERKGEHGLTRRQEAFVRAFVANGDNGSEAARAAGYAASSAYQRAYELLRLPHVQQAIRAELTRTFDAHAPLAFKTIARLAVSAESEQVRYVASKDILDRSGYRPAERIEIMQEIDITLVDARIQSLLVELDDQLPKILSGLPAELRAMLPAPMEPRRLPSASGDPASDQPLIVETGED